MLCPGASFSAMACLDECCLIHHFRRDERWEAPNCAFPSWRSGKSSFISDDDLFPQAFAEDEEEDDESFSKIVGGLARRRSGGFSLEGVGDCEVPQPQVLDPAKSGVSEEPVSSSRRGGEDSEGSRRRIVRRRQPKKKKRWFSNWTNPRELYVIPEQSMEC